MLHLHWHTTGSTNDQARRLSRLNPGRPVLVSADIQSAGRGRAGRHWLSPAGGAWFTLAWPLDEGDALRGDPRLGAMPILVGAVLRRTLLDLAGVADQPDQARRLSIKWPNDLLLDDAKLAGVLCELHHAGPSIARSAPSAPSATLLIGVGVNVRHAPPTLPSPGSSGSSDSPGYPDAQPLRMPAASLTSWGDGRHRPGDVVRAVAAALRDALMSITADPAAMAPWLRAADRALAWRDQVVQVDPPGSAAAAGSASDEPPAYVGVCRGVADDGALRLWCEGPQGSEERRFHAGDVARMRSIALSSAG